MRKYSVNEAMLIGNTITVALTVLVSAAIIFAVSVILLKLLWAWTVPGLFPGAVNQGLIAASLTWADAAKAALLVAILSGANVVVGGRWARSG